MPLLLTIYKHKQTNFHSFNNLNIVKNMKYISTKDEASVLGFTKTIMAELASDGAPYLPEKFPQLSLDALRALRG
ncbi:hypothetical protein MF1_08940 [Bartonella quintana]|nr:hypothetical protein RM11_0354 [Bartonella quintana RM-11]BBL53636.1 hypothetical protein MF1_08940 [Bartonella quintana]